MAKAVITIKDSGGQKSRSSFDSVAVADAVAFLGTYSDAGVLGGNTVTIETVTPTDPEIGSNVDKKANLTFKNGDGELFRLTIPAPNATSVPTEQTEKGERVTQAGGEAIATAYGTLLSETLTFIRGSITQRV